MKTLTVITGAALALAASIATAGEPQHIDVWGTRDNPAHVLGRTTQAVDSCMNSFANAVIPARNIKVRMVDKGHGDVLADALAAEPGFRMKVKLDATTPRGKLLATGTCETNGFGRITSLQTQKVDSSGLASL